MFQFTSKTSIALAVSAALLLSGRPASADLAKNVILLISDGQGFNTVKATDLYTGSRAVYEGFDVKYAMQTNSADNPDGYDPAQVWSSFEYLKSGATDSASAASAMYAGVKIYDGQINMTTGGQPITTFFETVARMGKSIGAVSSVEFSHATPAAVYAHNISRNNYSEIAREGIYGSLPTANNAFYDSANYDGNLKVLIGAGHPDYDNSNRYAPAVSDKYVGGTATWADLVDGTPVNGWTVVENQYDFQGLMTGPTPDKVLGVPKVNATLQYNRAPGAGGGPTPYYDPENANVPTLEEVTRVALNVLDNDADGFAVMIEGGAVDWAGHGNDLDRQIEEQIDFNNSVQAVVDWVEANSDWDETLLIVTADHETGYLLGPGGVDFTDANSNGVWDSGEEILGYRQLVDNGKDTLPGHQWFSSDHTNSLVPLYAKGAGAELFADFVVGTDSLLAEMYGLDDGWDGEYVDNTAVYQVMMHATGLASVPLPPALWLLGSALMGLGVLRRRRV